MAQSNVVFYGRLDESIENTRFSEVPGVNSSQVTDMAKDTSYWGFRGTEDLGDGMKAYFKLEAGFYADSGVQISSTAMFNREAYLGLGSKIGSLQMGSQYSPALLLTIHVDPFQRVTSGSIINLMQSSAGIHSRGYLSVQNNAVHYISPSMGGVTLRAMYGMGESATAPLNVGNFTSVGAEYVGGPLYLGMTYEDLRIASTPVGSTGDNKTYTFGATYDLTGVKLHGYLLKNILTNSKDVNAYMAGVTVPIGQGSIRAAFSARKTDGNANSKTTLASIGYNYYFSKITTLYTTYSIMKNGSSANAGMLPSSRTYGLPAMGQDIQGLELGIRMSF